mmetsp:Transcript_49271/g.88597  ORF Transcript_49271/g.88597 Transcript_49271/m.88597 type:complete len:213 (-) Transcript_49271:986-1624(-)
MLLICLIPDMNQVLLHRISVGRIGLRVLLVFIVGPAVLIGQAAGDALQLLELRLRQLVRLLLGDGGGLLSEGGGVEHLRDDRTADLKEVAHVDFTMLIWVDNAEDHVDLHARQAELVCTQQHAPQVPNRHDVVWRQTHSPGKQDEVCPEHRDVSLHKSIVKGIYAKLLKQDREVFVEHLSQVIFLAHLHQHLDFLERQPLDARHQAGPELMP